jgi:hypothetical protein
MAVILLIVVEHFLRAAGADFSLAEHHFYILLADCWVAPVAIPRPAGPVAATDDESVTSESRADSIIVELGDSAGGCCDFSCHNFNQLNFWFVNFSPLGSPDCYTARQNVLGNWRKFFYHGV